MCWPHSLASDWSGPTILSPHWLMSVHPRWWRMSSCHQLTTPRLRPTWTLYGGRSYGLVPPLVRVKTWGLNTDKLWPRVIPAPATANLWSCYKSIMKIETFQLKTVETVFDRNSPRSGERQSRHHNEIFKFAWELKLKALCNLCNCMRLLLENWLRIELQMLKIARLQFGVSIVRNYILLSSSNVAPGF